jgi:two-component system LytT family response regulator
MRILLCDDDPVVLQQMERLLKKYFQKMGIKPPQIVSYLSGEKLLESHDTGEIAFLDVEMPGISGIYTGERLKKVNPRIKIFILTSYMDYLDEAMKFHVFRYLSKPVDEKRLFRNMKEALYQIEMETEPISIETKNGVIIRQAEDIIYIETDHRKTKIITVDQVHETVQTIRDWKSLLQIGCFFQTHRSFIVNMRYVTSFAKDTVTLTGPGGQAYTAYLTKRNYSLFKNAFYLYLESTR